MGAPAGLVSHRLVFLVVLAALAGGCTCGRKSDEEILRERIDTTSVHLYLASKVGILKADQSPEARAARDQLLAAIASLEGSGQAQPDGSKTLTAADYLALAKALWSLRQEGKELLASGDEKGMRPVLPLLFTPDPALAAVLDLPTEHALLLTGLFVLKFHPRSPTPVPDPIVLYEAWMTDAGKLKLGGLRPVVRSIKAVVYSGNELCDLAAKEGAAAEREAGEAAGLVAAIGVIAGKTPALSTSEAEQSGAGARAIAHGAAATCYLNRDQQNKAVDELDALVKAAADLGVPRGDTALIRGYIALQRGKREEARKALVEARDHPGTDADTRKLVEELIAHLDDEAAAAKLFDKPFFALQSARVVFGQLERAGAFDDLKDAKMVRALAGYLGAAAAALGKVKEIAGGKGIAERLKGAKG